MHRFSWMHTWSSYLQLHIQPQAHCITPTKHLCHGTLCCILQSCSTAEATSNACPVECILHSLLSRYSLVCRYDVVCALGSDIKHDIINMVQPEWHGYYDAKVCILDQFSHYVGEDILRTGGTAILESELSNIIRPVLQDSTPIPDLLRPSLHKGDAFSFCRGCLLSAFSWRIGPRSQLFTHASLFHMPSEPLTQD